MKPLSRYIQDSEEATASQTEMSSVSDFEDRTQSFLRNMAVLRTEIVNDDINTFPVCILFYIVFLY